MIQLLQGSVIAQTVSGEHYISLIANFLYYISAAEDSKNRLITVMANEKVSYYTQKCRSVVAVFFLTPVTLHTCRCETARKSEQNSVIISPVMRVMTYEGADATRQCAGYVGSPAYRIGAGTVAAELVDRFLHEHYTVIDITRAPPTMMICVQQPDMTTTMPEYRHVISGLPAPAFSSIQKRHSADGSRTTTTSSSSNRRSPHPHHLLLAAS